MRKAIIKKHQSLLDIALQYCGNADALFAIAELNDLEPTQEVAPGTELLLPDEVLDPRKVNFLKDGGYEPATGVTALEEAKGGLEIWALELDFIIS